MKELPKSYIRPSTKNCPNGSAYSIFLDCIIDELILIGFGYSIIDSDFWGPIPNANIIYIVGLQL